MNQVKRVIRDLLGVADDVYEIQDKFDELFEYVWREAVFQDSKGLSHGDERNTLEIQAKWTRLHELHREFRNAINKAR